MLIAWFPKNRRPAVVLMAAGVVVAAGQARADFVFTPLVSSSPGDPSNSVSIDNIQETDTPSGNANAHYYAQPVIANDPDNQSAVAFLNLGNGGANYSVNVSATTSTTKSIETVLNFVVSYQHPTAIGLTVKERNGSVFWLDPSSASFSGTLSIYGALPSDPTNYDILLASTPIAPSAPMDPPDDVIWNATAAASANGLALSYMVRYDTTITATGVVTPPFTTSYASVAKDSLYFDLTQSGSDTPNTPEPASLGLLGLGALGLLARRPRSA